MKAKDCLLISCGPGQLIGGLALLQSREISFGTCRVASLYDSAHEVERFGDLERGICAAAGVDYAGVHFGLPDYCKKQLRGNVATFLLNKGKFFENIGRQFLGSYQDVAVKTLIFPHRPNRVTDSFFLHMVKPAEVMYYQEGLYLKTNDNLASKALFRLAGFSGYEAPKSYFSLPCLPPCARLPNCDGYIDKQVLAKLYEAVADTILGNNVKQCADSFTLLLWQDLYPRFVKSEKDLFGFYKKLIDYELCENNKVMIKPHPRCDKYQLAKMGEFIANNYCENVALISADDMIPLPAEIVYRHYGSARVAGVSSTGMFLIGGLYGAKIVSYYDRHFPSKFIKLISGYNEAAAIESIFL